MAITLESAGESSHVACRRRGGAKASTVTEPSPSLIRRCHWLISEGLIFFIVLFPMDGAQLGNHLLERAPQGPGELTAGANRLAIRIVYR